MTQSGQLRPSFKGIGSYDDDHDLDTLVSVSHEIFQPVNDEIEAACAVNIAPRIYERSRAEKSGCYERIGGHVSKCAVCEKFLLSANSLLQ
jgi:hypothetical protein